MLGSSPELRVLPDPQEPERDSLPYRIREMTNEMKLQFLGSRPRLKLRCPEQACKRSQAAQGPAEKRLFREPLLQEGRETGSRGA